MSDSDDSHSRQHKTRKLTQDDLDDPGPRRIRLAARDVNGRRCHPSIAHRFSSGRARLPPRPKRR